ncbi:hypothetical protein PsorP6_014883 [Peronosclerospora sorghi]|uniref:Uncharacterized protein n=1 Tax=Peronosclerospora sorghi TaxID=230839 RepID=A0ACC0VTZ9_9STRA|nr:hypothetical protein PsorP6_014883 [Peronosclerospora sorghi]
MLQQAVAQASSSPSESSSSSSSSSEQQQLGQRHRFRLDAAVMNYHIGKRVLPHGLEQRAHEHVSNDLKVATRVEEHGGHERFKHVGKHFRQRVVQEAPGLGAFGARFRLARAVHGRKDRTQAWRRRGGIRSRILSLNTTHALHRLAINAHRAGKNALVDAKPRERRLAQGIV